MNRCINVLFVEDDDDHYFLVEKIWRESSPNAQLWRVADGEELMGNLQRKARREGFASFPRPDLIILDINMPRKDGWEVLAEIKSAPAFRSIPIVVMTTSNSDEDMRRSYELGASSFIHKPAEYRDWLSAFAVISRYWFDVVSLPGLETTVSSVPD